MRKILIIDDNYEKREYLKDQILRVTDEYSIIECECLSQSILELFLNSSDIDLIFLDWTFPNFPKTNPVYEQGLNILDYLSLTDLHINTIIFSVDNIELKQENDNVSGILKYNPNTSIEEEIRTNLNINTRRK